MSVATVQLQQLGHESSNAKNAKIK